MDGVLLFADDEIFTAKFEKMLYQELLAKKKYPVIGVDSLDLAANALRSISSVKAFIVDWTFKEEIELGDDKETKERYATEILEDATLNIFSLIYVYSQTEIENSPSGKRLKERYRNRIKFRLKSSGVENVDSDIVSILGDIENWERDNKGLLVPISWSGALNQSVQSIFSELENADPNWIKELYDSSVNEGAEPSLGVINLFQNILSESIIQNEVLRKLIKDFAEAGQPLANAEDYAKLIRILYYSQTQLTDPRMTGDIFKLDDDKHCIIITPECDIRHMLKEPDKKTFEVLTYAKGDFQKNKLEPKFNIKTKPIFEKIKELGLDICKNHRESISGAFRKEEKSEKNKILIDAFTQIYPRFHILPCYEFVNNDHSGIALIDFRFGLELKSAEELVPEKRIRKLNSPYIQELRQRYLSYKGRVGVPAYSNKLKEWLLSRN